MRSSLVCVSHWLVLMLYTGQVYYGGKSSGLLRVWWLRFLRCPRTQDKHCCAALTRTLEVPIKYSFLLPPIVSHVTPPFVQS